MLSIVLNNIVRYPGFAWLKRRVWDMMIEFIGPLYNLLEQFTNHYLTHCHIPRLDTLSPAELLGSSILIVKVKVILRPTVNGPVCLGIKHPFGT
jgi:hypothetical protein